MQFIVISFILAFSCPILAEALNDIINIAGLTTLRTAHGLTGKGVTVVVHDGFEVEPGYRLSHGHSVEAIIKAGAPGANIVNVTNIFLKGQFTDARASSAIVASFIAEKHSPRVVNLSWGADLLNKFVFDFDATDQKNLIAELARFGAAVVIAAGNEGELAGTNQMTREQAVFIDRINNDPSYTGGIILVGAGDIFSPAKRNDDAYIKDLMASYSTLGGTSRNHFLVGGPKTTGDSSDENFESSVGTSFTAPVVSAALALLAEKFPQASGKMLIRLLLGGATDVSEVFKRPEVKQHFVERLVKTTDLRKEHWHRLKWYDIFGRGVVNAKASFDLGQKIFARKTIIFPKNADMIIFSGDTSYITEANSLWSIFEQRELQAERNLEKHSDVGKRKALAIVKNHLWPFMKLWPFVGTLPFSAENKYNNIGIIAAQLNDFDLAYDIYFEGLYYCDRFAKDNAILVENVTAISRGLGQHIGKTKKDEHIDRALSRLKANYPDFDPSTKWAALLETLRAFK